MGKVLLFALAIFVGYFGYYCCVKGDGAVRSLGWCVVGVAMLIVPMGFNWAHFGFAALFFIPGIIGLIVYDKNEKNGTNAKRRAAEQEQIQHERTQALASHQQGEPWRVRYASYPCPHCGHYKVRAAKWEDKQWSVAFWGAASSKLSKEYKCEHCGEMW